VTGLGPDDVRAATAQLAAAGDAGGSGPGTALAPLIRGYEVQPGDRPEILDAVRAADLGGGPHEQVDPAAAGERPMGVLLNEKPTLPRLERMIGAVQALAVVSRSARDRSGSRARRSPRSRNRPGGVGSPSGSRRCSRP
jgi:hypothetical protein